jgi:hypothetical protein
MRETTAGPVRVRESGSGAGWLRPLPAPLRAIIVKDWRMLPRDPRFLSRLVWPFVMVGFFTYQAQGGDTGIGADSPRWDFWRGLVTLPLLPLFLGDHAMRSVGLEGRNFFLIRAAPLSMGRFLLAKYLAYALPVLLVTCAAALGLSLWRDGSAGQIAGALAMGAWLAAGMTAANLAGGALAPKFEADNPQRAVAFAGQMGAFLTSGLFGLASLALFAWLLLRGGGVDDAVLGLILIAAVLGSVLLIGWLMLLGAHNLASRQDG